MAIKLLYVDDQVQTVETQRHNYVKLSEPIIVGREYRNSSSVYKVIQKFYDTLVVLRPSDGWTCTAHGASLYLVDGELELQWDFSTGGHFEEQTCLI